MLRWKLLKSVKIMIVLIIIVGSWCQGLDRQVLWRVQRRYQVSQWSCCEIHEGPSQRSLLYWWAPGKCHTQQPLKEWSTFLWTRSHSPNRYYSLIWSLFLAIPINLGSLANIKQGLLKFYLTLCWRSLKRQNNHYILKNVQINLTIFKPFIVNP